MYWSVKSFRLTEAAAASRMVLSSTSVRFITWVHFQPKSWRVRRSTSSKRKVRRLPIWAKL